MSEIETPSVTKNKITRISDNSKTDVPIGKTGMRTRNTSYKIARHSQNRKRGPILKITRSASIITMRKKNSKPNVQANQKRGATSASNKTKNENLKENLDSHEENVSEVPKKQNIEILQKTDILNSDMLLRKCKRCVLKLPKLNFQSEQQWGPANASTETTKQSLKENLDSHEENESEVFTKENMATLQEINQINLEIPAIKSTRRVVKSLKPYVWTKQQRGTASASNETTKKSLIENLDSHEENESEVPTKENIEILQETDDIDSDTPLIKSTRRVVKRPKPKVQVKQQRVTASVSNETTKQSLKENPNSHEENKLGVLTKENIEILQETDDIDSDTPLIKSTRRVVKRPKPKVQVKQQRVTASVSNETTKQSLKENPNSHEENKLGVLTKENIEILQETDDIDSDTPLIKSTRRVMKRPGPNVQAKQIQGTASASTETTKKSLKINLDSHEENESEVPTKENMETLQETNHIDSNTLLIKCTRRVVARRKANVQAKQIQGTASASTETTKKSLRKNLDSHEENESEVLTKDNMETLPETDHIDLDTPLIKSTRRVVKRPGPNVQAKQIQGTASASTETTKKSLRKNLDSHEENESEVLTKDNMETLPETDHIDLDTPLIKSTRRVVKRPGPNVQAKQIQGTASASTETTKKSLKINLDSHEENESEVPTKQNIKILQETDDIDSDTPLIKSTKRVVKRPKPNVQAKQIQGTANASTETTKKSLIENLDSHEENESEVPTKENMETLQKTDDIDSNTPLIKSIRRVVKRPQPNVQAKQQRGTASASIETKKQSLKENLNSHEENKSEVPTKENIEILPETDDIVSDIPLIKSTKRVVKRPQPNVQAKQIQGTASASIETTKKSLKDKLNSHEENVSEAPTKENMETLQETDDLDLGMPLNKNTGRVVKRTLKKNSRKTLNERKSIFKAANKTLFKRREILSAENKIEILKQLKSLGTSMQTVREISSNLKLPETSVLEYVKNRMQIAKKMLASECDDEHFVNANLWLKKFEKSKISDHSDFELAIIYHEIADHVQHPDPEELDGIDLKKAYKFLANALEGKPQIPPDGPTGEFLKEQFEDLRELCGTKEAQAQFNALVNNGAKVQDTKNISLDPLNLMADAV
ncbi:uncharacterized protein LOC119672439 [Teleopsis dalmanni]|uniref:uncharacterized protein LOC119672439 n=1 Tax=Teleopsis dalmanni TaxID=139649 RepID=UPI0018CF3CED|nr:uncharacterized protein LOC119672439 [Teleopsis dalmanni]